MGFAVSVTVGVILENSPVWGQAAPAQPPAAQPAPAPAPGALDPAVVLQKAKDAFEQKNYTRAIDKYRQFINNFATRPEAPSARYGLALALAMQPERDNNAIVEALNPIVGATFAEKPFALYYLGLANRAGAIADLKAVEGRPQHVEELKASAARKLEHAVKHLEAAAAAFAALPKSAATPGRVIPIEMEWTARAKCDQADALIRAGNFKAAAAIVEPLTKDAELAKSRYGKLAGFYLGWANFNLNDHAGAGRALSVLAPFDDPAIGLHARYLLGRTHQLMDEAPEAAAHFEAVVSKFETIKKAATESLKNLEAFKERPDERVLLESLTKSTPDYAHEARFQWAVALQQQGQFAPALERYVAFTQQSPKSPLLSEAVLRQGICRVELGQHADGVKSLSGLMDHATFGEMASWWAGKGQMKLAESATPKASVEPAIVTLQKAAEKAKAAKDPEAKVRRGLILIDVAEAQSLAKQYPGAAATLQTVLAEKASDEISEIALSKLAVALGVAGQFAESDKIAAELQQKHPKSVLTPAVVFRSGENAFAAKQLETAAERYGVVVNKYPEFAQINQARKGLGTALYQLNKFEEAAAALQQVPTSERIGELSGVSYLLAECLIKTMPAEADDALSTARLVDHIEQAATLLNAFVTASENHPEVPGALLKIGSMRQKAASVMLDMEEKQKNLIEARDAYVKVVQRYPSHPQFAVAVMENAKVSAQTGDLPTAINQLNRFQADPLKAHNIAPAALIQLGDYLRQAKRAPEAVALLTALKAQEPALLKDPARAPWVATLQYNLGLALKDSGKFAEARSVFEAMSKQFATSPEAIEASWRVGQSQREEAVAKLEAAEKALLAAGGKPAETATAQAQLDAGAKAVKDAAEYNTAQAAKAEKSPLTKLRMMHEVALCFRALAEAEFDITREKMQREAGAKRQAMLAADLPKGRPIPALKLPEVAPASVPAQPSEAVAKEKFTGLAEAGADTPFAVQARVELAELLASRGDVDGAIKLLDEAVKQDGPAQYIEKLRIQLAHLALGKKDVKTARAQFEAIIANAKSSYMHHAKVGLGECLAAEKQWPQVVEIMLVYRTTPEFKRLPEVADRAMLRLGQAYAAMGQWEPSRLALDAFNRYHPASPLMPEAKFSMALALQNLKQFDPALSLYREVAAKAPGELGAKAQLQIGMTLLEMKQFEPALDALIVVPLSWDYSELSASALCEAGKALIELKKMEEAKTILNRVVKDHPTGTWAELAKKRLAEIK
jgi:tetratricopeptide (TPR) repeat protein